MAVPTFKTGLILRAGTFLEKRWHVESLGSVSNSFFGGHAEKFDFTVPPQAKVSVKPSTEGSTIDGLFHTRIGLNLAPFFVLMLGRKTLEYYYFILVMGLRFILAVNKVPGY